MNKSNLLFCAFFLLLNNLSLSQKVSIGIKTGVSHTDITGRFNYRSLDEAFITYNKIDVWGSGDKLNISKWKVNSSGYLKPTLGLAINYQINNHYTLQSELNYEEKGFDFYYVLYGQFCYGNYKINYLTAPVLLSYEVGKSVKFYLYEGVSFNFLLHARNYIISGYSSGNPNDLVIAYNESYYSAEINKKELEAALGIGTKIPISNRAKFIIDTRYSTGITRAVKNTFNNPHTFQNVFNRSITLSWGVLINFNRKKKAS